MNKNIKRITILSITIILICMAAGNTPIVKSDTANQEVSYEKPLQPSIVSVANMKKGIKITWGKVENAEGYLVYCNGKKIKKISNANTLSYTDKKNKKNGRKCIYQLYAYKVIDGEIYMSSASKRYIQYFLKQNVLKILNRKSKKVTASWTKNKKASGYQIAYSRDASFKKEKVKTVKGKNILKLNLKGLKKSKNYYVRVRSYIKLKEATYYSYWSTKAKIIAWNSKWEFAKYSAIHSDSATLYYSVATHRKNRTVCINAGHGTIGGTAKKTLCHPDGTPKVTGGSTASGSIRATSVSSGTIMNDGTSEATVTLKLALSLKKKLLKAGYNVLMVRETSDAQLDNIARTVFANNNADYHIALHYDSSTTDKGAFYISVPDVASYRRMYPVSKNWKKHNKLGKCLITGMRKAGVKIYGSGSMPIDLTQTSYSTISSVDLEVGDRGSGYTTKSLNKISDGIVKGMNLLT